MEGLRRNGVEVVECHESLWHGVEDRVRTASGGWKKPSFWWRVLRTYSRLLWKFRRIGDFDILWVGYPGQFDVFLAWLLARIRRTPLVWDIFMSIYLVALELELEQRSPFTVKMLRFFERIALRLPDLLIQDTPQYVQWLHNTYNIPVEKFRLVPIGVDDRNFHVIPVAKRNDNIFRVVYYGTYIPNHGVGYMIEAARLLNEDKSIHFDFIGQGPDQPMAQALAKRYNLQNTRFIDWMEKADLVKHVAHCDVCLGTFSTTRQSLMTVHNKIYEGMAMKKVVLTGDSPAVRSQFSHCEHIFLIERRNPASLADAIRTLRADPELRSKLVANGEQMFREHFDVRHIGERAAGHLRELISK